MSDNRNPHKLDPAENERVFREEVLPRTLGRNPTLRPSESPTMLVVGGQPGAGKTNSINSIKADFTERGSVLVVDLDALRERHPKYTQLMRADDKAAAQYTYDDARIWAQKLEDYAKANRHNVLVESLMTSPDSVGGWLQDYRAAGYRTEAHVVAVNERSSLQGIVQRYEGQKLKSEDNVGRTVPRQVHDLAYDRVRDTFDRIETDKLLCERTLNLVMEDTFTSISETGTMTTQEPISPELQIKIDALTDEKLKKDIIFLLSGPGMRTATNEQIFNNRVASYEKSKAQQALWRKWSDEEVFAFVEYFKQELPDDYIEYLRQEALNSEVDADLSWKVEQLSEKWISGLASIDYILLLGKFRDHLQAQLRTDQKERP